MLTIEFINKIKNNLNSLKKLEFYYNKNIIELLDLFKFNNWLDYELEIKKNKGIIRIKNSNIKDIKLISKPSRVIHIGYKKLIGIKETCILSTSQGLLTKEEAYERKIGGILLLKIVKN